MTNNMTTKALFRRARLEEVEILGDMTLEGVKYWGHDREFPELIEEFRLNNLPTVDYIHDSPVYVMEEHGRPIGYFGLIIKAEEGYAELEHLFLDTRYIGKGYGRRLWQQALVEARKSGCGRMRIVSDPGALGFYEAMGAVLEKAVELQPGFALGVYWYDLTAV